MKAAKCILAVLLGLGVALLSACTPRKQETPEKAPKAEPAPAKKVDETPPAEEAMPPAREKDLPIREPILE